MHVPNPEQRLVPVPPPAAKPEPFIAAALFFLFLAATGLIVYKFAGIQSYNQRLLALTAISGINGLGFIACIVIAVKRELSPELATERMLALAATKIDFTASYKDNEISTVTEAVFMERMLKYLRAGADVNAVNEKRQTALHSIVNYAVAGFAVGGQYTMIDELIKVFHSRGADVNAKDIYDNTPLHYAAARQRFIAIAELVGCGAKLDARNNNNVTPFYLTVAAQPDQRFGFIQMVKIMREKYPNDADYLPIIREKQGLERDLPIEERSIIWRSVQTTIEDAIGPEYRDYLMGKSSMDLNSRLHKRHVIPEHKKPKTKIAQ